MSTTPLPPEVPQGALDEATAARLERLIEEEEGAQHRFRGLLGWVATGVALAMALFHLWAAWDIVPTTTLRFVHVGFAMVLGFLLFPAARRFRNRLMPWDMLLIAAALGVTWYLIWGGDMIGVEPLLDRYVFPEWWDLLVGWVLIVLVIEVTRRATGSVMPIVAALFLLYGFFGNLLPPPWQHQGYDTGRLIPHLTITLDGIFGTAVDVSASLIILFTIYGAILQASGAGKFFVDFSFAATGGRATSAGRTVVLSSFLLGGPSGSGVATTVTLGTVAWPMMKRVGYRPDDAGGLLAAGGLGAIISPPVLGAAAFLIAEYLKISYLEVLRMAAVPTVLYYASLLFMVELDQRRIMAQRGGALPDERMAIEGAWALVRRQGFHFTSLLAIVVFMVVGYSPTLSVLYAMGVAVLLSFLTREGALWPWRLVQTLAAGATQAVGIAATCACAGIIVGVITLTGLGLKFSDIAIQAAGGSLLVTALYTALIVWVVGLAVPVT
ncbi:MAG: TRAP transporter fused permease subunit, partial [Acetobacteraceae bacterium]|nr:TRAP transporter fused permease subunit [Acetobacteraceae bacterium]